jgi:hypothetical protein
MFLTTKKWEKIVKMLQKIMRAKTPCNGKMCKDKWNGLNFDFKNISKYHIGIDHHTSFWDLTSKKYDSHHLPRQCNKNFYDAIKFF